MVHEQSDSGDRDAPDPKLGPSASTDGSEETLRGTHRPPAEHWPGDPSPMPLEPATMVGRFRVLHFVESGAMGRVYAAYDDQLDRRVALKLLWAPQQGLRRQRALQEARAMARLSHPNVVQVFEVGEHEGHIFVAMEFMPGQTLRDWQSANTRDLDELLAVYARAGEGISAAHEAGLVHRDFKPANVMVHDDGGVLRVKVLDFGLALPADLASSVSQPDEALSSELADSSSRRLTRTGQLLGTPAYMAPEQFSRGEVGPAADQFAFCVSLWEAVTGERPFVGSTIGELFTSIVAQQRRTPRRNVMPAWLESVLERGLAVSASDRYPTMQELLAELDRHRPRARWSWLAVPALVLFGSGFAIAAWRSDEAEPCTGAREELASIWAPEHKSAIRTAFASTHVSYADTSAETIVSELDDYARRWRQSHRDACEASTIRGEQSAATMDLRMACLAHAKATLSTVVSTLEQADPVVVRQGVELLAGLETLPTCADLETLRASRPVPPPDAREAVLRARQMLPSIRVDGSLGRFDAARRSLSEARALVAEVHFEPISVELDLAEGRLEVAAGNLEPAEMAFRRALEEATALGLRPAMREALIQLIYVVGNQREQPDEALRYVEIARGLVRGNPPAQAELHDAIGTALATKNRFDDAVQEFEHAIELAGDTQAVWRYRSHLAAVLRGIGRLDDAETLQREVLEHDVKTRGPSHPDTTSTRETLGMILADRGQLVPAREELQSALRDRQNAFGPDHPEVARCRDSLARVLRAQGELNAAEQHQRAALEIIETQGGASDPRAGLYRGELALTLWDQGKLQEADQQLRAAIRIRSASIGDRHPDVARLRGNLASLLQQRGQLTEAEAEHRAVLQLLTARLPDDQLDVILARNNLATVLLRLERPAEALVNAEKAYAGLSPQTSPAVRAFVTSTLARVLGEAGSSAKERARARRIAEESIAAHEAASDQERADSMREWIETALPTTPHSGP